MVKILLYKNLTVKSYHEKYIEINWLQDINIIQLTVYVPYISATNGVMNNCHLLLFIFLQNYYTKNYFIMFFYQNMLLLNNNKSVSNVKKLYQI